MAFNEEQFKAIKAEFEIDGEHLQEIAASFRQDLQLGLRDVSLSSMRMLKSYVGLPSGKETGEYLALDFGGTNIRVFRIRLDGDGKYEIIKRVGRPLIVPGEYDYICKDATAEQMFDFIAELIDEAIDGDHDTKYYLGHTFSFPSTQDNLYNARLIIWTKEFATQGVEGEVANDLLVAALKRRGAENVVPVAVLNDTVAVLLSAAYKTPNIFIGSIYATGHNTCYLESSIHDPNGVGFGGMILNLECGNFMKLMPNRFDREYDEGSEKPGEQRFEKMVSGRYMGELLGMAIAELLGEKGKKYGLTSIDMSMMVLDDSENLIKASDIMVTAVFDPILPNRIYCIQQSLFSVNIHSLYSQSVYLDRPFIFGSGHSRNVNKSAKYIADLLKLKTSGSIPGQRKILFRSLLSLRVIPVCSFFMLVCIPILLCHRGPSLCIGIALLT